MRYYGSSPSDYVGTQKEETGLAPGFEKTEAGSLIYPPGYGYEPAWWEKWRSLTGSKYYKDWFEGMFSKTLHRFQMEQATKASIEEEGGRKEEKEPTAEWVKRLESTDFKEIFSQKRPYERGERPSLYGPVRRTVQF